MDAEKRLQDLISVTQRLIDVLERENALLREHAYGEIQHLLDEKEIIARVYEARIMHLKEHPGELDGANEETRATLKELSEQVDGLIKENGAMLQTSIVTSKRIIDMVADALREKTIETGTYANGGRNRPKPAGNKHRVAAISINETL